MIMIYKFGDWVRCVTVKPFKNWVGMVVYNYKLEGVPNIRIVYDGNEMLSLEPHHVEPVCWKCRWGKRNEFNDEHR